MRVIADLKARDREVRAHEAAHKAASGQYAGAVHLDFTTGPDGQQYAVGGEVSIDTSPVAGDPEATVEKMRTIQAAATAPANPSAADRAVAAKAAKMAMDARMEADRMASEESKAEGSHDGDVSQAPGYPDPSSPYSTSANDAAGQILSLLA